MHGRGRFYGRTCRFAQLLVRAPLEVQYWIRRSKAAEHEAVGPPWIFTSSGGFSSGMNLRQRTPDVWLEAACGSYSSRGMYCICAVKTFYYMRVPN